MSELESARRNRDEYDGRQGVCDTVVPFTWVPFTSVKSGPVRFSWVQSSCSNRLEFYQEAKLLCFALLCFALLCFALLLRVVDAPKSGFGSSGRTRDAIYTTLLQSAPAFDQSESCRRLLGQLPLSPASCYTVLCCAVCPAAPALNSPHCLPSFFPTPSDIAQHVGQAAKVTYPPPLD